MKPGYIAIGKGRNLSHTVVILIFMLGIWLIGTKFVSETAWFHGIFHPMASTTILLAFVVVFRDPGFMQRKSMQRKEYEILRKEGRLRCTKCLTLDTDNTRHCSHCDCCVTDLDHHCDVFGTCIAKNNLYCFWGSVGLGMLTLTYVYVNVTMFINTYIDAATKTAQIPQVPPKS